MLPLHPPDDTTAIPEVATIPEVARFLRVSKTTVYKMIKDGELPAKRIRGQWRIMRHALQEYLADGDAPDSAELPASPATTHPPGDATEK